MNDQLPAPPDSGPGKGGEVVYAAVAEWSPWTRRVASVLLIAMGLWLAYLGRTVMQMLIVAAILAFIVHPVVQRLEARRWHRAVAVGTVYFALVAVGLLAIAVIVPEVVRDLREITEDSLLFVQTGQAGTESFLEAARTPSFAGVTLDFSFVVDPALATLRLTEIPAELMPSPERMLGSAEALVRTASGLVAGISGLVFTLVLTLFFALHMSLDGPRILKAVADYAGESQSAEYDVLAGRVTRSWGGFFHGQLQLSLTIGFVVWIGAVLLGLPGALVLGILAGLLEVLPNIGPVLATIPAVAVALIEGSNHLPLSNVTFALVVVVFYVLVQQVENAVIVPRVIGGAVDLPPLVVMVAVIVGAKVGGVLGAFVAAPFMATLKEIVTYAIDKIRGLDPYPEIRPLPEEVTSADPGPGGTEEHW